jgi:threonyl-tRNA synthetase
MSNQKNSNEHLNNLRHSTAHLLAAAVMELYPNAKRTIGPSIENGFYFDFDNLKIAESDLPKIEEKMKEIVKSWKGFEGSEVTKEEAIEAYKDNPYKIELIEEFAKEGQKLTFYKSGDYSDLCRGGHVPHPNNDLKHFKLLKLAGAYWRGDEKNKMLTRIYGTAFPTKDELDKYLWQLDEAEKRDHKKIGRDLELFIFHETAPGMAYWLPKGVIMYNEIVSFWREEHKKRGYQEIVSPLINKKELYETSGHWEHYMNDMFVARGGVDEEESVWGLKPMNCPNAMIVFGYKTRSYKELPLKLGDTDTLHRNELTGTLNGLLRIREFRQDDAHIFVTEDQIKDQFAEILEITERFYSVFGLDYRFRLGTRNPESFMGDVESWDKAEKELKEILDASGKEYFIAEGDGAFYGPKIDILMKDALGRDWQMGTIQLDMQMPKRFGLVYSAQDGTQKTPIAIHRVVYGSLERFIGILIEHTAGAFPTWLAPIQVVILPIADRHLEFANKINAELQTLNLRSEVDARAETLGAKIRDAQNQKVPYMLVVGDKEVESGKVSVRSRDEGDLGSLELKDFLENFIIRDVKEKRH